MITKIYNDCMLFIIKIKTKSKLIYDPPKNKNISNTSP